MYISVDVENSIRKQISLTFSLLLRFFCLFDITVFMAVCLTLLLPIVAVSNSVNPWIGVFLSEITSFNHHAVLQTRHMQEPLTHYMTYSILDCQQMRWP